MALTKVGKEGVTGISNSSNATAITIDSSENVTIESGSLLISNVGGVGVNSTDNIFINATNTGIKLLDDEASVIPCQSGGSNNDNALDLGFSSVRWKDLYLSGRLTNDGTGGILVDAGGDVKVIQEGTGRLESVGGIFLGGTSSGNLLDDYEEGSWTGTLTGASSAPSTAVTATGSYTKIGRLVTVTISFSAKNTSGASGALQVTGLPFSISDQGWGSYLSYGTANTASSSIEAVAWANSCTAIVFYDWADSGVWNTTTITAGSDRYLFVSLTYATT